MRRLILVSSFWLLSWAAAPALAQPADDPAAVEPAAAEPAAAEPAAEPPAEPAADAPAAGSAAEPAATTAADNTELPASEEDAKQQMLAAFAMTDEERTQYAAALRDVVAKVRGKVMDKITAKLAHKQESKLDNFALGLSLFALCGVFLLAMPLVLRKKYPGKGGALFKYSALAALLFFLAVNLFATVLLVMRGAQGVAGKYTNPQVKIVESTFDLFADKAEDLAVLGPTLVEPTLASLTGDSDVPVVSQMLANVQRFKQDFTAFTTVANVFKKVDWLFGILPIILIGVGLFLFAKVARPTLTEIVKLPERAVSGAGGVVKQTVKLTLRNVWAEAKAAFAAVGLLIALSLVASVLLGLVLQPALEIFIAYLTLAMLYVQLAPDASTFWVLCSLLSSMLFLVLNLAVVVVSSAFFLGKAQRIFQAKFREGVALRAHKRFWGWGAVSAVWAQALPVLYIVVAVKGIGWLVEKSMGKYFNAENPADSSWGFLLASGPAMFLVTFVAVFWAARGFKALAYLAKYKVPAGAPAQPSDIERARAAA